MATTTTSTASVVGGRKEERGERKRLRHAATQQRHAEQQALAETLRQPPSNTVEFASRWDGVYSTRKPYKDRHVLRSMLPELMTSTVRADPKQHILPLHQNPSTSQPVQQRQYVLEIGCGTGSSIFPVLRANPSLHGIVFDISSFAIQALKDTEEFKTASEMGRLVAFRADACDAPSFMGEVENETGGQLCDYGTLVWTLSAMDLKQQASAVRAVSQALKPGAMLYLRDFAAGDMRHVAFKEKGCGVIGTGVGSREFEGGSDRLFLRGDGTYAYFFTAEEVVKLFESSGLFKCEQCEYEQREVINRKQQITMHRRWVVAKFRRL